MLKLQTRGPPITIEKRTGVIRRLGGMGGHYLYRLTPPTAISLSLSLSLLYDDDVTAQNLSPSHWFIFCSVPSSGIGWPYWNVVYFSEVSPCFIVTTVTICLLQAMNFNTHIITEWRGEESSISRFNLSPESANGAAHSLADSPNGTDMRMGRGGWDKSLCCPNSLSLVLLGITCDHFVCPLPVHPFGQG